MAGIKETFSKSITTINVKTSGFMEENKIKTYISSLESKIEADKRQLGQRLYAMWKTGESGVDIDQLEPIMQQIQANEAEIENQRAKIEQLHAEQQQILGGQQTTQAGAFCPQCGAQIVAGAKFCNKCGAQLS